ncbi:MAG: hypothetical protein C4567_00205 [Deltaproteobacteria bacterium]|nr:MAG: hypothetical protein C4567_00205 [Deltaproteobacteria bacterium]
MTLPPAELEGSAAKSAEEQDLIDQLNERINGLTCELLQERISRIDFQVQLLSQWRQNCQQELNRLLSRPASCRNPENQHG